MSTENKTIKTIIERINSGNLYIPAIQRKYIWDDKQVIRLMDSIMRGYPIGIFLFWNVNKTIINDKEYSIYSFIKDYHERDAYNNPRAPLPLTCQSSDDKIWIILDGQQRLTSLYIALQGTMSRKILHKQWKTDNAFPSKELYYNVFSRNENKEDDDDNFCYEFDFFSKDEMNSREDKDKWLLVKEIVKINNEEEAKKLIKKRGWDSDLDIYSDVLKLYSKISKEELISYFEVTGDSMDRVLDIFVRVNSGGTVLSKSDLLFSTIVSHWDKGRDEVDDLLKSLNKYGEGYRFNTDFIMRTCLYLMDESISFKVENFKKENVDKIRAEWSKIKDSIQTATELLDEYGFSDNNILSYNAIMPIIYYIFKGGSVSQNNKKELRKFFIYAQLKRIFRANSLSTLTKLRQKLNNIDKKKFKVKDFEDIEFTNDSSLKFNEEDIDDMFTEYEFGAQTFMVLSLLYPNLKFSQKGFHQDHMHPYAGFENKKIKGLKLPNGEVIDDVKIQEWQDKRNKLANLQLLEGKENKKKKDTPLVDWLKMDNNKETVKYLPKNISYKLSNFDTFTEKRQKLMAKKLKTILLDK